MTHQCVYWWFVWENKEGEWESRWCSRVRSHSSSSKLFQNFVFYYPLLILSLELPPRVFRERKQVTWKSIIHTKEEFNSSLSKDNFLRTGKRACWLELNKTLALEPKFLLLLRSSFQRTLTFTGPQRQRCLANARRKGHYLKKSHICLGVQSVFSPTEHYFWKYTFRIWRSKTNH